MSRRGSLAARFTLWFTATMLLLYGIVATALWRSSRQHERAFATLTLKSEVEALASYVAASGRFDAPELHEAERSPFPIWLRILDGDQVVAATPGMPEFAAQGGTEDEVVSVGAGGGSGTLIVVRHRVGGTLSPRGNGFSVEAVGALDSLDESGRRQAAGLAILGLMVIPLAALGGALLARRALAPLTNLVHDIGTMSPGVPGTRLAVPASAVREIAVLAESFNRVLTRLDRSFATRMRFTEDASHEIRNPLAVMRTGLEVALRKDRTASEYRGLLRENVQEIERLQSILDGLLGLARTEPGREAPLQRETIDLPRLLEEAAERLHWVSQERRAPIQLAAPANLQCVGDLRLLRLAIFNLLDNALKHSPEGTPIRVSAEKADREVRVRVHNAGRGIPRDQWERIFERYLQIDPQAAGGPGGLGLSVVRWAVEAHSGTVRVVPSEEFGGGTTFEVLLPRG